MRTIFKHIKTLVILIAVVSIVGCSTEKNSPVNRTYHNVTARYNGYFNAKESIKEGVTKLEESHIEDYSQILPIKIYGDESASRSIYPQMDRAIEKCSNVINNHSMYIKKVEYCAWVDDSYFLIGKASFFKKDFERAEEMLVYVANEYKDDPIHFDAMLWLAKSYIEAGDFSKARGYFNKCEQDEDFPEKKLAELKSVKADFYLKQQKYPEAAKELKNAISYTQKRKEKVRLTFILAQVYNANGDSRNAIRYYDAVLKLNPEYEMEFYANIHSALAYEGGNSGPVKTKLLDMTKDEKYDEFYDQIYFALAELELKENKKKKGIEYLKLSYETSMSNTEQKTKSFNRLADLYFADKSYVLAQAYYDSTVATIDKGEENYGEILERRNSLTRLVKDILIVEKEDSLQVLAKLPKKEQVAIVDDIIRKIIEEEEQKKAEEEANALQAQNTPTNTRINQGNSAEWYFYNPSTVSFGKSEFKKKWGTRKLEDNWRRKDKSSSSSGFDDDYGELEDLGLKDTNATSTDLKSPRYYLQNIPNSKGKKKKSDDKIIAALYDLGLVYKEKLKDDKEAIKAFESLVTRYDTSKFHVSAFYQLYRLYTDKGNTAKANTYKNKVLKDFPKSQYAKLIKDPGYLDAEKNQSSEVAEFYEKTYDLYKTKKFGKVISNANQADSLYKGNDLLVKFDYLRVQSIGETQDEKAYEEALRAFIEQHTGTPQSKVAQRTLEYLTKGNVGEMPEGQNTINYIFKADAKHHMVVILPKDGVDMNKMKIAVSDFNRRYFKKDQLKISSTVLDSGERLLIIKTFNNVFKGMNYYKSFDENKDLLKEVKEAAITKFPISTANYPEFYKGKDIDGYQKFFDTNYK